MDRVVNVCLAFAGIAVLCAVSVSFVYLHLFDHSTYYSYVGNVKIVDNSTNTVSTFRVMVATTPLEWQRGLMYRSSIFGSEEAVGMLFAFSNNRNVCMWMKNTYVPLQIDWISNNTVMYVEEAYPGNLTPICHYGNSVLETYPNATIHPGDSILLLH